MKKYGEHIEKASRPKLEKQDWGVALLAFVHISGNVSDIDGSGNEDNDIPNIYGNSSVPCSKLFFVPKKSNKCPFLTLLMLHSTGSATCLPDSHPPKEIKNKIPPLR